MGKGPGTIYKDCLANARTTDKILASQHTNDIQAEFNAKYACTSMYEIDVRRVFFDQNYSERTTEKAIRQWAELDLVSRITYKKYQFIAFWECVTSIKGAE